MSFISSDSYTKKEWGEKWRIDRDERHLLFPGDFIVFSVFIWVVIPLIPGTAVPLPIFSLSPPWKTKIRLVLFLEDESGPTARNKQESRRE